MISQHVRLRIVLTGPESSGKTTLARALADFYGCGLVPEFARSFLDALHREYQHDDLARIERGQAAWEQWHAAHSRHWLLVCDTDWTVIRIWESFKYGSVQHTLHCTPNPDTLYLLCQPDIEWEPDPLRENPGDRDDLFGLYEQLLRETGCQYSISGGNVTDRLQNAVSLIEKYS
jgi:nicotinamide riboside kinase